LPEVSIGVLNLDVEPDRVAAQEDTPGFLRSDETLPFKVKKEIVRGATIERVVREDPELIPSFVKAAKTLEARGAKAIVGDCGFISAYQGIISGAVSIPVASSSLLLVPLAHHLTGKNKRVGIITAEAKALAERHFQAVGWNSDDIPIVVKGMDEYPAEHWEPFMDHRKKRDNIVKLAEAMLEENRDIGAIVLECTLIQPYARAIHESTGLPVYDITTLAKLMYSAVNPPNYEEKEHTQQKGN